MEYSIKIPDFLLEKLKRSTYNKLVEEILTNYSEWISRNDTIFFREYTDHGVEHLESILETSVLLLTDESKKIFSDSDACLLVISTILHDVALHIQEYQFIKLVEKGSYNNLITGLDTETWHSLWIKYSAEASRFSQAQLHLYFGVSEPIQVPDITEPNTWTPLQYQLIGEFLRRHHPRLAHDFAIYGFPAVDDEKTLLIKTESDVFKKFIDLAGLVARSHGTSLRGLFEYLQNTFGHLRSQEGSHAIYIMTVLRIADFLQLQPSRAPKGQMIVKNLRSPLSRREWGIHSAIQSIIYNQHEDPESVEVIIDPAKINIELFLRIQELFTLLQKELDYSWAVLGEVYGRFNEKCLGLTIRRVRSNIDNKVKFSKQAGFVTEKATFTAADAELLKLFIKPLYGDKPEIAVRELVQNSVDAVRERKVFEPNNFDLERSTSVIVSIHKVDDGKWMLRIEDKGIGMSLNTIIGYFLNAGASYRLSTVWKQSFLDEKGKAKVLRSGRFGVGALAAFMLAEDPTQIEMKVVTRHISSLIDGAFEFKAKLSDSPIQIKYVEKKEPGTIIEILTANPPAFMQESTKENTSNSWDWFCLDNPIVERFNLTGKRLPQSVSLPASIDSSKYDYHWIYPKDYSSIGWTYEEFPAVVCNGIIVIANRSNTRYAIEEGNFVNREIKVSIPAISIFDKDGKLPITLDRLRIEYDQLQFLGDLREDIEKNILAFLLITTPNKKITIEREFEEPIINSHPSFKEYLPKIPWLLSATGATLYCPELFHINTIKNIIEISNPSFLPFVFASLNQKLKSVGFAIDVYSVWDQLKKNPTKIIGGTRLKVERPRIMEREVYKIIDLIDNNNRITPYENISERKIDEYLERKFGYRSIDSPLKLIDLLHKEIYEKKSDEFEEVRLKYDSSYFREIERSLDRDSLSISDLKQAIYQLGKPNNVNKKDVISILDHLYRRGSKMYRYHDNEELLYNIEREIENLYERSHGEEIHRLRDEIRYKLRQKNPRILNHRNLEKIMNEIRRLNQTPPVLEIERFGNDTSAIDWEKVKTFDFYKESMDVPIAEIVLDEGFKHSPSDNFLAKIWLEYMGDNEIPFNEVSKKALIAEILKKTDISRHLTHWENVLQEETVKRKK